MISFRVSDTGCRSHVFCRLRISLGLKPLAEGPSTSAADKEKQAAADARKKKDDEAAAKALAERIEQ